MHLDRILMPTDFSDCANAALTHAVFLARRFEAEDGPVSMGLNLERKGSDLG